MSPFYFRAELIFSSEDMVEQNENENEKTSRRVRRESSLTNLFIWKVWASPRVRIRANFPKKNRPEDFPVPFSFEAFHQNEHNK